MTLIEMLISSGLFLVISGIFFATIIPIIRRSDWLESKQSRVRGSLIAKEILKDELHQARVQSVNSSSHPTGQLLTYVKPQQTQTAMGTMAKIDFAEVVRYETDEFQITIDGEGQLSVLRPDLSVRKIWFPRESLRADSVSRLPDERALEFQFTLSSSEPQSYRMTIFTN